MSSFGIDDRPRVTWDDLRNFAFAIAVVVLFCLVLYGMTAR